MMQARIRLMEQMVESEMKEHALEEIQRAIETEATPEERACFYAACAGMLKKKEEQVWEALMTAFRKRRVLSWNRPVRCLNDYGDTRRDRIMALRAWAENTKGEDRLHPWGELLAVLDYHESREEIEEIWMRGRKGLESLPEEKYQATMRHWMLMLVDGDLVDSLGKSVLSSRRKTSLRLMRFYPLEPKMNGQTRLVFYRLMAWAQSQAGEDQAAVDWATKGMNRMGDLLEADQMFLYLEEVIRSLGRVGDREAETAKLMRHQWELAQDLGAYATGAKLSIMLLQTALEDEREQEAWRQWNYLQDTIKRFGTAPLFSNRERDVKRWIKKLKRRLDRLNHGADKVF